MNSVATPAVVLTFAEVGAGQRPQVGGKCASLGELLGTGVEVPDGFAVTVDAFESFRDTGTLRHDLRHLVRGIDADDPDQVAAASRDAIQLVESTPVPDGVAEAVRTAYAALCERHAQKLDREIVEVPVAVRSSSVDEDGDTASFAGQQETYLWVVGGDAVVEHLRRCWSSLYTPQAIAYRNRLPPEQGYEATLLAVGVQIMVDAEVAGVLFTASPRTGDRSVMAINASWGLGQAVVAGEVTPDEYWVDRVSREVVRHTVADKAIAYRPDPDGRGVRAMPVDEEQRRARCVDEDMIDQLVDLGQTIEQHYGVPQDIEWAVEIGTDGTRHLVTLQSRPETVLTKKQARPADAKAGGYMNIIQSAARSVGGQSAKDGS